MRPWKTAGWITVLYLAQGLPYGVTSKIWPVYFRVHGVSLTQIGLMSLLALPWSWKPLWAPLVDAFGSRRAWIAPALFVLAAISAAMPALPAESITRLLVGVLLVFTIASATQDLAIDAWAVEASTGREELGWINGLRASAFRVAVVLAGGVALVLADATGWTGAWWLVAAVFAALGVAALFLPRLPRSGPRPTALGQTKALFAWAFRRDMLPVIAFALLFKLGDQTLSRMVEPFWVDKGMTLSEIGVVSNTIGIVLTILGALAGGWFLAKKGLFSALVWLGLSQCLSNFGYVAVAAFDLPRESIYFASAIESFTQGLGTAAFLAFLTALCERERAATQYALLSALFAFSREIAGAVSGFIADELGYTTFFTVTALAALPALALLPVLRRRIVEAEANLGGGTATGG